MSKDLQAQIAQLSATQRELLKQKLQKSQTINDTQNPTLSFSQERIWFLEELEPGNPVYNRVTNLSLTGKLNIQALEQSINEIIHRHEVLRTSFITQDGLPTLVITPQLKISLPLTDLSELGKSKQQETLQNKAVEFAQKAFDLSKIPLLRAKLVRLTPEKHILLLTIHHIVFDGWSAEVFLKELGLLYEAFCQSKPSPLSPLSLQYQDFAQSQKRQLQGEKLQLQLNYWKKQLAGELPVLQLPTDYSRPKKRSFSGAIYKLTISKSLTDSLKHLSQKEGVTLFMTLLAAFKVLLYRYTSQEDILVGSPIAGRDNLEVEDLIGVFINTLVFRTQLDGNLSFRELLTQVRQIALEAYANKDVPFEKLVEELQPERNLIITPIFQVFFQLRSFPEEELVVKELTFAKFEVDTGIAGFDLTLDITEKNTGLVCCFKYNTDLFEQTKIINLARHFQNLLEGIIRNPEKKISLLPLLTASEKQQILIDWNDTKVDYPKDKCIHQLFEAQVEKTPNAVAVVFEDQQLTYKELNDKVNQLAHYLRKFKVKPETLVGICVERSLEMIIGLLGILKAGGAYVPIDPNYPTERIKLILEDAHLTLLLTQANLLNNLPKTEIKIICLEQDWSVIRAENINNPENNLQPCNLAYLIYTSGSTGKPKGVMIEHQALSYFSQTAVKEYDITVSDRILQFANITFDAAVEEIFPCLISGATLTLRTDEMSSDLEKFIQQTDDWKLTVLDLPTAYWNMLVTELAKGQLRLPKSLRLIIIGGEKALLEKVNLWQKTVGNKIKLINSYGPTETTVVATIYEIVTSKSLSHIPIGCHLPYVYTYILDKHCQLLPVGMEGELHIGGDGLARGYVNRPQLTAEKFIDNPFGEGRLYKTGDLVRYLADGNIEYLGRIDHQVKIRGFRIELGEIETNLAQHPNIKENVVIAKENKQGDKYLAAYVVSNQGQKLEISQLRKFLAEKLPEYMIPSSFVSLDKFPLTPNGKIDRKALPKPDFETNRENEFIAPRNETETKLADIWQEILSLEKVGINDDFFALGGHSLLATQVVSRIRNSFKIELPLRCLFELPTIAQLSEYLVTSTSKEDKSVSRIKSVSREQQLPLSFAQQRLWFIDQLEGKSPVYNISRFFSLEGKLNLNALEKALITLIQRHETLRTNFSDAQQNPRLIIHSDGNFHLPLINLENLSESQQAIEVEKIIQQETRFEFDLETDSLIRFTLVKTAPEKHILSIIIHHIISDGWSMNILTTEIAQLYRDFKTDNYCSLSPLPIQYADFSIWQRQWFSGEVLTKQVNYWKQQLQGIPPLIDLPLDKPRPPLQTFQGQTVKFNLNESITKELKILAQQLGVTLYITLLAVFAVLLSRYSNQKDLVIGSPIANRNQEEIEGIIGFFANTLALRINLAENPSFKELITRVKKVALEAYEHQDLPLEKLVEELNPERNLSHHPLFQVMFAFQNTPNSTLELEGLEVESMAVERKTAKFDLSLFMRETGAELSCVWEYNTDLFNSDTIARMSEHFQVLIEGITKNPEEKISLLPLLTEAEKQQILRDWNNTKTDYPQDKCIHQLFEEQVEKTPDVVAVVFQDQTLTYQQLNEKANQLARYLEKLGVKSEKLVGICVERSLEMIIGLLGVMKAGGAYVPVDPNYPSARMEFMVEDAAIDIFLSQKSLLTSIPSSITNIVCLDEENVFQGEAKTNTVSQVNSRNLAYVIYTSGSTGKPKGVEIPHSNVVNVLNSITNHLQVSSDDILLSLASFSFDISVAEIFLPLVTGGKLIIPSEEIIKDGKKLTALINQSKTTIIDATPATWKLLETVNWQANQPLKMISTGEKLPWELANYLLAQNGTVWNIYGPTECTIWCLIYPLTNGEKVLIGKPLGNTQAYILDQFQQATPMGVAGELCIAGEGLARGYLNRPELTAEKFRDNPFGEGRLYKTGDLCRYLPDGNIEYLGRIDHQVKIRGFRIELGEIEANLAQHPNIKENVVIAKKNKQGDKYLAAYVVSNQGQQMEVSQLRKFLAEKLPEYMIPSAFVFLEKFPLTPNGKIDRQALPEPDFEANRETEFIAPCNETEIKLAQIWQEVLGIEKVGIHDNFFALGGHSLLATQVVSRIQNRFELELPLSYLFESPTIGNLGLRIDQSRKERKSISIPLVSRKQELSPSFAQERLWFITELEGASSVYNMSKVFKIYGNLNLPALEKAIAFVFQRHESLRSNFDSKGGKPCLIINQDVNCSLNIINLENQLEKATELEKTIIKERNRVFDLAKDTLIRFTLIQLSAQEYVLMIVIHHIICDGWSIGILMKELSHLYEAYRENKTPNLPALPIQYVDFGAWQREYLQGNLLEEKLSYWREKLENVPPLSTFPLDYPRPTTQTFTGGKFKQRINNSLTNQLQNLTQKEGVTLFITLLTALKVLLYRHTQQEKLIIGFPIAGRNNLETEKLIGFFVNTLLISSNLGGNPSFLKLLNKVKNSVFKAYEHQDLPFEKLVQEIQPERELSHNPLFQVWFNMVNLESEVLELNEVQVEDLLSTDTTINSKFDLTIYVRELEDSLELSWVYNKNLYQEKTINWLAQQYQTLLEKITVNSQAKIQNISLLKNYQTEGLFSVKNKIIPDISFKNFVKLEIEQSITARFEQQVKSYPGNIAITTKNQQWTYQQLNQKANQIAHQILSLSSPKVEQIALLFEHDAEMIASLLAVLKTGKIYVPLDASYPEERLIYILENSQASLLLTNSNNYDLANKLTPEKRVIVNVDEILAGNSDHNSDNLSLDLTPETIAYILYTSGSTGKPKGVVQNHRNVLHFIRNYSNNLHISARDKISLLASISFDAAVMDIFGALLNGATLCLYDVKTEDLSLLPQWLESEKITIYHSTPTLYRYLIKEISTFNAHQQNLFPDLRLVVLGGEEVVKKDVEAYKQYFGNNCLFVNGYGPTESTVTMQYFIHQKREIAKNLIPIGYPVEDTEILLLDEEGNNSQILGEIAIKSEYVALGYWRQSELTKKVFLKDSEDEKKSIYRTGDWGRFKSDGTIEFLGRKDFQIKIRGIRIELGEIEANINQHPNIEETVVIARENRQEDKYLVAYLVSNQGQQMEISQLRKFLAEKLPEYMIPSAFVFLDKFPLTPNGKIDRKALPEEDFEANRETEFIAPRNETEMKLAGIWQEVLGIEKIGINDDFFALGGHSLLATQVVSRIQNRFEVELPLRSLFEYSTIAELSEHLTKPMITLSQKQDRETGEI